MAAKDRDPEDQAPSLAKVEHKLIHHTELPRTASGKVMRRGLKALPQARAMR